MARRYRPPAGYTMQGFVFALDPTRDQVSALERCFGARRFARNWTVAQISAGVERFRSEGVSSAAPSLYGLRKKWNVEKRVVAVDAGTGEEWWPEISKEVFNDGIRGAVDAYWRWQKSRAGKLKGRRVGFPRFHKRCKHRDSFTVTRNGSNQVLVRRGVVHIPRVGWIATHESTRKLARLVEQNQGEVLAVTVSRRGTRLVASVRACVLRPQRHHKPTQPDSRVGVDVGERVLAVVARPDGTIVERVPNPEPLTESLAKLRRLNRRLARQQKGSNRWLRTKEELTRYHRRAADIRRDAVHKLTTRLAKTHGETVIEDLNVAGMRKGGAKHMRDAPLGEFKRQMAYKTDWHDSSLVLADRYYPSSKTCSACGETSEPGKKREWRCAHCGTDHDRDNNAAINLARYHPQEQPHGRVDPEQAPAVRSGGISHADRSDARPGTQPAAAQPCKHKTSKEAA